MYTPRTCQELVRVLSDSFYSIPSAGCSNVRLLLAYDADHVTRTLWAVHFVTHQGVLSSSKWLSTRAPYCCEQSHLQYVGRQTVACRRWNLFRRGIRPVRGRWTGQRRSTEVSVRLVHRPNVDCSCQWHPSGAVCFHQAVKDSCGTVRATSRRVSHASNATTGAPVVWMPQPMPRALKYPEKAYSCKCCKQSVLRCCRYWHLVAIGWRCDPVSPSICSGIVDTVPLWRAVLDHNAIAWTVIFFRHQVHPIQRYMLPPLLGSDSIALVCKSNRLGHCIRLRRDVSFQSESETW